VVKQHPGLAASEQECRVQFRVLVVGVQSLVEIGDIDLAEKDRAAMS
jgi:hypothetical protein